ncbi:MAG: hypothetical protein LC101_06785 [Flavobacteriales bacterium]|nr:hypothetical protein [Flavobacteriales bacterium]
MKKDIEVLQYIEVSPERSKEICNQAFTLVVSVFSLVIGFGGIFFAMAQARQDYDITSLLMEESYFYLFASISLMTVIFYFFIGIFGNHVYTPIQLQNAELAFVYVAIVDIAILVKVFLRIFNLSKSDYLLDFELDSILKKLKRKLLSRSENFKLRQRLFSKIKQACLDKDLQTLTRFLEFFFKTYGKFPADLVTHDLNWHFRQLFVEIVKSRPKAVFDSYNFMWSTIANESVARKDENLLSIIDGWISDIYNNRLNSDSAERIGPAAAQGIRSALQWLDFRFENLSAPKEIDFYNNIFRWHMVEFLHLLKRMIRDEDLDSFEDSIEYFNQCRRVDAFKQMRDDLRHEILTLTYSGNKNSQIPEMQKALEKVTYAKDTIDRMNFILKGWAFHLFRKGKISAKTVEDSFKAWPLLIRDTSRTISYFLALYHVSDRNNFGISHWNFGEQKIISGKVYSGGGDDYHWLYEWLIVELAIFPGSLEYNTDDLNQLFAYLNEKIEAVIKTRGSEIIAAIQQINLLSKMENIENTLKTRLTQISALFADLRRRYEETIEATVAAAPISLEFQKNLYDRISAQWKENRVMERIFEYYKSTAVSTTLTETMQKTSHEVYITSGKAAITEEHHFELRGVNLGLDLDQLIQNIFESKVFQHPTIRHIKCHDFEDVLRQEPKLWTAGAFNPDSLFTTDTSGLYSSEFSSNITLIKHDDDLRKSISNGFVGKFKEITILRLFSPHKNFAILSEFSKAFKLTYFENPSWQDSKLDISIKSPSEADALATLKKKGIAEPTKAQINHDMNSLTLEAALVIELKILDPKAIIVFDFEITDSEV